MAVKKVIKHTQEQAEAAWINYLRVLRTENLLEKLSAQDCNIQKALKALNEVKIFIANPSHILGSAQTKHGEVAEHMQVAFVNAEEYVQGKMPSHTFEGVGRTAMEDYLRDGQMIQSKFYNGVKGTFNAVCHHLESYPDYISQGGRYDIPREQYEKLMDIYNRGEMARSSLMRTEETLYKAVKAWEADNGLNIKAVVKPAIVGYDEVQLGVADNTIHQEEQKVQKMDEEIRTKAHETAKPTLQEGVKATAVAAVLEGGMTFAIKVYQKRKAGKKIQDFTHEDWKEVGLETLVGTGKGAARGAVVYTMTNYTPVPSPIASAMVTASFGVTAQARKMSKGELTAEEFVDNCEVICLDVAVSALSSMLGEIIIPIPILGTIIGNTVGMFMYEISKTYLTATEQKLIEHYRRDCETYIAKLDNEYCDFVSKLNEDFSEFNSIIILAFDGDMNQRFETSIRVARNVGASEDKLLRNSTERDAFFSEE